VLSSAPAQAATTTTSAGSEMRTHAEVTASVEQSYTRAQLRTEVVVADPSMRPADVEAVTELLAGQAALSPQVIPAAILLIIARCAIGSMSWWRPANLSIWS
jgi:hypothetical protein